MCIQPALEANVTVFYSWGRFYANEKKKQLEQPQDRFLLQIRSSRKRRTPVSA